MKNPKLQAGRWLKQAEHDLLVAHTHLKNGFYSDCCFMCEQTGQKAVKAFLVAQGERFVLEHSVGTLMKRAIQYDKSFQELLESAGVLDQYYIPTRYPDVLAEPAVPFESYSKDQASRALESAQSIQDLVKRKIV